MARTIDVTVSPEKTEALISELRAVKGLFEIQVLRGVSVEPVGDVIRFTIPNMDLHQVMKLLDTYDLGRKGGLSMSTSVPTGYIPSGSGYAIERDDNEAIWEEMAMTISNESNSSLSTMVLMFISGAIAAVGLATNALHIVIGAMLVAPGFMPITRIALGVISRHRTWYYGSVDLLKTYLSLMVGAACTTLILNAFDYQVVAASDSYYPTQKDLVRYWVSITAPSILSSTFAGVAGTFLISTKKSLLATGVMIALALVPTAAIVGIGLVEGSFDLALKGLFRFVIDIAVVLLSSLICFLFVRWRFHQRDMRL